MEQRERRRGGNPYGGTPWIDREGGPARELKIRLGASREADVKAYAKREDISLSEAVRRLIDQALGVAR